MPYKQAKDQQCSQPAVQQQHDLQLHCKAKFPLPQPRNLICIYRRYLDTIADLRYTIEEADLQYTTEEGKYVVLHSIVELPLEVCL